MTTTAAAPDYKPVKLIKGVQDIAGNLHPNMKAALAASADIKVRDQLRTLAGSIGEASCLVEMPGVYNETSLGNYLTLTPQSLGEFLYANRKELAAALQAEVRQRKPYSRKPKAAKAATPAAS